MPTSRLLATFVLLCVPLYSAGSGSVDQMGDDVAGAVNYGDWSAHTCRRVEELGKGTVSPDECIARVDAANTRCMELAKARVPVVANDEQGEFFVMILMSCPVADVLGIGYVIKDGKIYIQWSELAESRRGR